jgi:signal transduction histidine kinase/ligand-binding sensor domain-containing protein
MMVVMPSRTSGWSSTLRTRIRVSVLIAVLILPATRDLRALSPLDLNQYAHTAWTLRDGTLRGSPRAFAQGPDGYLWIGTEFGVLRFDGVRLVPWQPPKPARLPETPVVSLLATRDGALWIGTMRGLARWANGALSWYDELADAYIAALVEGRDGRVWVGTSSGLAGSGRLCAIAARVECHGQAGEFGRFVLALHEDQRGVLWVGTATGLWRWGPDRMRFPTAITPEIHAIAASGSDAVLFTGTRIVGQMRNGAITPYAIPGANGTLKPTALLRDTSGGLWIGTQDQGLLYVHGNHVERFSRSDGLSGDFVAGLFQDREGNIWVATMTGFDRFRALAVATVSAKHGLPTDSVSSVLADRSGAVWLGTARGLALWHNDRVTRYAPPAGSVDDAVGSLFQERSGRLWVSSPGGVWSIDRGRTAAVPELTGGYVHAMAEDRSGALWISDQDRGLFRLRDGHPVERIPWAQLGGKPARALAAERTRDGLWLGFFDGGIAYLENGTIRERFSFANGPTPGRVVGLYAGDDGAVWAATDAGLKRIANGKVTTLGTANGLPCDTVHWPWTDAHGSLWLHSACGLVRIQRADLDAWIADPDARIRVTVYDEADGVASYRDLGAYTPKATVGTDGRLWFVVQGGVGVVDPARLPSNPVPPPVHIEQVTADGTIFDPAATTRLAADVRDVFIDYTALSLIAPAKVRFRYMLEGRDTDWIDVGTRRQAVYSSLPPNTYRFRVIASNNDGLWNDTGASWTFTVPPAFYETAVFRVALGFIILTSLALLYQMHMRRVRTELHARFEARLGERARIAQELHDTLLQGFVSASMQLYMFADEVKEPKARLSLERILRRVTTILEEGRQAVYGLRQHAAHDDLEKALTSDAEDFRGNENVEIHIVVSGQRRPLQALPRDEVYRIAREALANAFKHAAPRRVDLEVEYAANRLSVRVRDDGKGIDSQFVEWGRTGHWGIRGMRERAESIDARLRVSTRVHGGTEVEIDVPGHVAFPPSTSPARSWWQWPRRGGVGRSLRDLGRAFWNR